MTQKPTIRIDDKPDAAVIGHSEMVEILANEQLIERLRKGSSDAKLKKGAFKKSGASRRK